MIEIPVYNTQGQQTGSVSVDEIKLGGVIRPELLKQAYVRGHANRRQGSARTKNRHEVEGSTKKLYKQKGTGNARRGDRKSPILRGGAHTFAKRPRDFSLEMPIKMKKLANRNALLAKLISSELKLVDAAGFDKPSTKQFASLLEVLKVDRSCLVAVTDMSSPEALSAKNCESVTVTQIDRLNVFDLLNHRYMVAHKDAFVAYLEKFVNNVPLSRSHKAVEAV